MENNKILEEDDLENKIVPKLKKGGNLVQTGRYLRNKFYLDRLRRDLRNHPEYIQLVSYIKKILCKKSMQIRKLKQKVNLLKEKSQIINIERSTQTVDISINTEKSEAGKRDGVDSVSLRHPDDDNDKSYEDLRVADHPILLRKKNHYVEKSTQTKYVMYNSDKADPALLWHTNTDTTSEEDKELPSLVIEKCKSNAEQSTQTETVTSELNKSDGVDAASSWHSGDTTKANEQLSIAEQVKQVAENVIADAGMVYVESAGMYYDSKSGYYYSPELGLYYHNTTGCYYYFDKEKNEFSYYSHANTSQQNSQDHQQYMLLHDNVKKLRKSREKLKKNKRLENVKKSNRKHGKRKALGDALQNKKKMKYDEKHQGKISDHKNMRSREKIIKLRLKVKDIGNLSEKCNDENKITDIRFKKEEKGSDESRDSLLVSDAVILSEESNVANTENKIDSEIEDGECSSSEAEEEIESGAECRGSASDYSSSASCSSSDVSTFDESVAKHHPPCIRIVVKESSLEQLRVGSLYIVTKDGGSLGREGTYHSVILPDENVSRHHLTFYYDIKNKCYEVVDVGSQNGTILNGKRMSLAKQESERIKLVHGSTLTVGNTTLLCHVHDGLDTCGHCEPGLIKPDDKEKERTAYKPATNLRKQYKQELQRLRSKYAGVAGARLAEGQGGPGGEYTDRAAVRRETVGSSHSAEKTEQGDLHTSITESNKGFKMLEKMGWSKGEGLGKKKQGDTDPVPLVSNEGSSGLGAGGVGAVSVLPAMWRARPPRRPLAQAVAKVFQQQTDEDDNAD